MLKRLYFKGRFTNLYWTVVADNNKKILGQIKGAGKPAPSLVKKIGMIRGKCPKKTVSCQEGAAHGLNGGHYRFCSWYALGLMFRYCLKLR